MTDGLTPEAQRRLLAVLELVRRTGTAGVQIRYSDDQAPVVWIAVAEYADGRYEADAALDPVRAAFRLAEQLIDGGICTHCHKPTGLDDSTDDSTDAMPLGELVCWYQYDPELSTYRRGCE